MTGIGAQRYRDRRADGTKDRAIALPLAPEENDEVSRLAEVFFLHRYGLTVNDTRLPDGGRDCVIGRCVIDVKWTPLEEGRLLARIGSPHKPTVYVQVVGLPTCGTCGGVPKAKRPPKGTWLCLCKEPDWQAGSFRATGWIWGYQHRQHIQDLGHGPTYATDQRELRTNTDLLMATLGCEVVNGD